MSQFQTTSTPISGIGMHGMWGFSPAVNLLSFLPPSSPPPSPTPDTSPINILLLSTSDPRHVLKTLSQRLRSSSPPRPIHFYMYDNPIEVIGRNLLLLTALFDWEIPIRQRSTLFLEIYGNTLVQKRTSKYIHEVGEGLIKFITSNIGSSDHDNHALSDMVDFRYLKYRHRDSLETIFKSWNTTKQIYDISQYRDQRLRNYYGDRYDNRKNVLDWDYQTRIKKVASIIHIKQYREWRDSGVAFEFGDAVYDVANRGMGSFMKGTMKKGSDKGTMKEVQGFWLDIIVSPYVAFGVEVDVTVNKFAADLMYVLNKGTGTEQNRHHTVEVAAYNVMSMLWEVETGEVYKMRVKDDIFSGLGGDFSDLVVYGDGRVEANKGEEKEEKGTENENEKAVVVEEESEESRALKESNLQKKILKQAASRARTILTTLTDVKIFPITEDISATVINKPAFKEFFDVVYVSQHSTNLIDTPNFSSIVKPNGAVVMEGGRHLYAIGDKLLPDLEAKMVELVEGVGLRVVGGVGGDGGEVIFRKEGMK